MPDLGIIVLALGVLLLLGPLCLRSGERESHRSNGARGKERGFPRQSLSPFAWKINCRHTLEKWSEEENHARGNEKRKQSTLTQTLVLPLLLDSLPSDRIPFSNFPVQFFFIHTSIDDRWPKRYEENKKKKLQTPRRCCFRSVNRWVSPGLLQC